MVIVDAGAIVAFDPKTGKRHWTTKDYGAAYSSPVSFTLKKKEYLATFPKYGLVILNPTNGKEIAKFRWETKYGINAATPVIVRDNIFISSGYNKGSALLRFNGRSLTQIWSSRKMRNHMSTCLYTKGYLYGFDDRTLRCINFQTGKVNWSKRGLGKGALSLANEMLLIQGAKGDLVVAPASPRGFKSIAQTKVYSKSARNCWTLPVLVDKRIYCRNSQGELVCLDVSR